MKLQLNLKEFNLKLFLEAAKTGGKDLMTPNVFSIATLKYKIDDLEDETADELVDHLIENGNYVYVNFSSSAIDEEVECIDGHTYVYISEDEVEEYFEFEEVPKGFVPYENLKIYEDSSVGYLLKVKGEELSVQSAIHQATDSSINVVDDAEVFEKPMQNYVQRFMK